MKIDKDRFLLLATAIAATATATLVASATGCSQVTTTNNDSPNPSTSEVDSGTPDPDAGADADTDGDAAPACLGNKGPGPECGPVQEGQDPTGFAKCSDVCVAYKTRFKADVAREVSACVDNTVTDPTQEGDCTEAMYACAEAVLPKACDDETAAATCTTLLTGATEESTTTQAECERIVRALNEAGLSELQDCVSEGFSDYCFRSLLSTL